MDNGTVTGINFDFSKLFKPPFIDKTSFHRSQKIQDKINEWKQKNLAIFWLLSHNRLSCLWSSIIQILYSFA
ncbi:MAG: hypothetical protein AN484_05515 [Aphanizomenon flos-aquae WA102]|uniref:Uncharacterized protein n=1 Tax=Aphanizomenon flos-aquae WA102 TaxID=1710896 RepID=A0A1B7X5P6_APHFL|nr:MAG: hypothetical protein AN484_05515 [Aphanizomenon flos-aquae WA102]